MTQDEQHLDLLATFHYVVGGLTALMSCMFFLPLGMGIAMLTGALDGASAPPRGLGLLFVLLGSCAILAGWTLAILIIAAGRRLKRRMSHTFCLVVAALECMITPFGTVLGIFTIIVLMRESVKAMFAEKQRALSVGG